jgi:glycosyltransferase involved in cell wall biosynthesis
VPDPAIGVVVPAYNAADYLAAALDSLLAQTLPDWVAVVVDDGSTDGTGAVARAYAAREPRLQVISQPNRGKSHARNAGLARLPESCRYVMFADADDVMAPRALEVLAERLAATPGAVGAFGYSEWIDPAGAPLQPGEHPRRQDDRRAVAGKTLVDVPKGAPADFRNLVVGCPIVPAGAALHRRGAVEAVGGFDPAWPLAQDWDLYQRTSREGPFVMVDEVVAYYRKHPEVPERAVSRLAVLSDDLRRSTWESPDNTPEQRRAALWAWRQLQLRRLRRAVLHALHALRAREWRAARRFGAGVVVAARDLARRSPQPGNPRDIYLTGAALNIQAPPPVAAIDLTEAAAEPQRT